MDTEGAAMAAGATAIAGATDTAGAAWPRNCACATGAPTKPGSKTTMRAPSRLAAFTNVDMGRLTPYVRARDRAQKSAVLHPPSDLLISYLAGAGFSGEDSGLSIPQTWEVKVSQWLNASDEDAIVTRS